MIERPTFAFKGFHVIFLKSDASPSADWHQAVEDFSQSEKIQRLPRWSTSFAVVNYLRFPQIIQYTVGFPLRSVSSSYQNKSPSIPSRAGSPRLRDFAFRDVANLYSTFYEYLFIKQMPSSYLASKPPPNPGLPNWLAWTKNDFFQNQPGLPPNCRSNRHQSHFRTCCHLQTSPGNRSRWFFCCHCRKPQR